MSDTITPQEAAARVLGAEEVALIDLRDPGPFSEGHPLFAVPCPYSDLETSIGALVPRASAPVIVIDGGDKIAQMAADALARMGYTDLSIVQGGTPAWEGSGHTLYKGVHVPSKTLGELAELTLHPRPVAPADLAAWLSGSRDVLFFDTRPAAEHAKMTVPGAVCLPNGELPHRIDSLPADRPIVLTCAGRTRGIVGAASLSLIAPDREVWWLEDGTQGWRLAGLDLAHDTTPAALPSADAEATRLRAGRFIATHAIPRATAADVEAMRADAARTTYVLDVRDPSETAADPVPCARPAPVVTLVQATDQFIGLRRARVVLVDDLGLRGALAAYWLRALGHEVAVCTITDALRALSPVPLPAASFGPVPRIAAGQALADVAAGGARVVDLRTSLAHQAGTVTGAIWSIRSRLWDVPAEPAAVYLIGDATTRADLAAETLLAQGRTVVRVVEGGLPALAKAGAAIGPGRAMDLAEAVDIISFAHGRHDGDADASRLYLSWEKGLVDQLSADERAQFHLHA